MTPLSEKWRHSLPVAVKYLVFLMILIPPIGAPVLAQSQAMPVAKVNSASGEAAIKATIPADISKKHVLLLHAYSHESAGYQEMDPILLKGFADAGVDPYSLHFEFMDLLKNPEPAHRREFVKYLKRKFEKRPIDLIITLHRTGLIFLFEEGKDLFPGVPVINVIADPGFVYSEDFRATHAQILGALKRPFVILPFATDAALTMEAILNLQPETRSLVVISGSGLLDRGLEQNVREALRAWQGKLQIEYWSGLPLERVLERVAALPPKTVIMYTVFQADPQRTYRNPEVLQRISKAANAPVFGLYDTLLGMGIVGGVMAHHGHEAKRTVQLALEILRGNLPREPVTLSPAPPISIFDWEYLKRWKLNEDRLPPGSIVLNRPKAIWSEYKGLIIGGMVIFLAQTLLVIWLLIERNLKKRAKLSLGQKTEELDKFFNVSLDLLGIANTDGYFLRLNPIAEKILGYSREELMAKPFFEFIHPDDVDKTHVAVSSLGSQRKVFLFENRYRCKDGTYRWLEWSATPAGTLIYAAARDVTERKLAELTLERQLRFESLVSNISAGFVNLPFDEFDNEINKRLRSIAEFFDADECTIRLFSEDRSQLTLAFEYHTTEIESAPESISDEQRPWYMQQLIQGNAVVMNRLEDLPPEAARERQYFLDRGFKSAIFIPIVSGGKTLGSCALVAILAERVWPKEFIPRLRLLGEILINAWKRNEVEKASRESERILRQNENDLRKLAGKLIHAQEEERSHFARELHDDLAQRLAVFAIEVGKLEQQSMDAPAPVQEQIREMKTNIVKISQDVHSLSRQLHPSILDDLGLIKAVESECRNVSTREGVEIVFNHENIPAFIPKDISLSLYRIIQEGLSNISKHACAEHITVSLKGIDHDLLLSVQDDGIGFDPAEIKKQPGLGFSSMRERARLIHGELSITSQPKRGTTITVRVPLMRGGE